MKDITEEFGSLVFDRGVMKMMLPEEVYRSLKHTMYRGEDLDITVANVVAEAMKEWALANGATHYTHWFQPMTGITAEKHDSFIAPDEKGRAIAEFSGKALIKGEPDASSFPSGGLRATFEARGYTAWDPTSCAFIKDGSLCIPSVFCSYGGEALDKKTPLLRSAQALNEQALRILKLFGTEARHVEANVGPEQEYFLIDKKMFNRREDLVVCGRTLFGAKPPKGQELEDHYFGAIKPRVSAFMKELDEELWKLGVFAKTRHNEAAPCQHELAPVYSNANTATDHNQLTMETMKKVADRHGFVCILQEKPFNGINGSGKHDNWSISTDKGVNLLEPGSSPHENAQFLLFLCAMIKAVDEHQDLLRISVATAGNDLRLGRSEAPPAVISIFLGDEITHILDCIEKGVPYDGRGSEQMEIGLHVLPSFPKDTTDRNRTSPFAFTGNKFEFRMPGSAMSVAGPNIVINTIFADVLMQFADELEKAANFNSALNALIRRTVKEHRRIIFNGDGYSPEWEREAERRGLLNLRTTADALPYYATEKNIALFTRHNVFTEKEMISRRDILADSYCKINTIEALTMCDMASRDILPAIDGYIAELAAAKNTLESAGAAIPKHGTDTLAKLCKLSDGIYGSLNKLREVTEKARAMTGSEECPALCRDEMIPLMDSLRRDADEAETLVKRELWPFPTYGDLLYYND
ncbi:MAG: glutamine synthetase III [Clostridia bacterium]|nr:glutamine synthetase III [Clostridia bacterium]